MLKQSDLIERTHLQLGWRKYPTSSNTAIYAARHVALGLRQPAFASLRQVRKS